MWITMNHSRRASEDGFGLKVYKANENYDVELTLASKWLHNGIARIKDTSQPTSDAIYKLAEATGELAGALTAHKSQNRPFSTNPQTNKYDELEMIWDDEPVAEKPNNHPAYFAGSNSGATPSFVTEGV